MTTRTLILTPWMAPERVISWQRATVLLHLGKAEILEEYNERIKGNRTPAEAGMPLRRAPFEPRSLPHVTNLNGAGIPASWTQYGVSRASYIV